MTKERKAAIAQWERIKEDLLRGGEFAKTRPYSWWYNCWFCQYIRFSRIDGTNSGCSKCPLWKYTASKCSSLDETDCGCARWFSLYEKARSFLNPLTVRLEACDLIIRALKGERIWEEIKE